MEADNCVHLPSENPSSTPPVQKKQRAVDDEYDFGDLVTNAYGNPIFNKIIQALFILQFDLLRSPRLDQLFAAAVEFSVEPVDFQDFVKIFADQPLGKRKIPGVVQVN
ncbi:hypothetical protein K438DRAFT_1962582 [Mycena galopus ATCC 62051]|nr:hypothetical protein K438DRAFT_1962582 [Mycena galopus ATCC 62051]